MVNLWQVLLLPSTKIQVQMYIRPVLTLCLALVSSKSTVTCTQPHMCKAIFTQKTQKLSYFGHIKQHNTLEKLFLEGTCEGRRGRGRPRRRWTQDIGEWMGVSTVEAGRQALERGEFCQAVWEATSIKDPP